MKLDINTIVFLAIINGLFQVMIGVLIHLFFKRKNDTLYLLMGTFCYLTASFLFIQQGQLPSLFTIIFANILTILFIIALIRAFHQLICYKLNTVIHSVVLAGSIFCLAFFTYFVYQVDARIIVVSLAITILIVDFLFALYEEWKKTNLSTGFFLLLGIPLSVLVLFFLFRIGFTIINYGTAVSWENNTFTSVAFLLQIFFMFAYSFIFMLMKTIFARKKTESDEKQFQTIFENASTIMIVTDEEGYITKINPAGLKYNKSTLKVGYRFGDLFHCTYALHHGSGCGSQRICAQCVFKNSIETTLKTGENIRSQDICLISEQQGELQERYFLLSTSLMYSQGVKNCLVMIENITDLKRASKQLQISESLLRETEELSKIGGWQYSVKNKDVYWTRGLYTLHELPLDSNINDVNISLGCYLPEDRSIVGEAFEKCCTQGISYDLELPFITAKKNRRWIRTKTRAVYEKGEILRVIGIMMDITNQKESEREYQKLIEQADEANSIKSRFLANMSHEMRTPLNGILGMLNLIHKEKLSSEITMMLEMAIFSAENMFTIVKDLLDLSRIDLGKMALRNEKFDFSPFIQYSISMLTPLAVEKNITIEYNNNCDSLEFYGDKTRITQILVNLISNAIKYSDEGTIVVSVDCDPKGLTFSVSDQGIGIPEERIGEIFTPFQQLEDPYTKIHSGIGAGLSIVKSLVSMMKGEISVESALGQGSLFTVKLPNINIETESGFSEDELEGNREKASHHNSEIKKILIVEDESTNRMYVKTVLQLRGYEVIEARNGLDAIEKTKAQLPDLVFMDIGLPYMNGVEATKRIRQDERFAFLPIIALTAHVSDEEIRQFLAAGLDEVIAKPYVEKELFACIASYSSPDKRP